MREKEKYNPKIDYLFCKYLYNGKIEIDDENVWKDIFYKKRKCENLQQEIMIKGREIVKYIKKSQFNLRSIKKCYKILTNEDFNLSDLKLSELKLMIRFAQESHSYDIAAQCLIFILKKEIFPKKWNVEMSKIIHNFVQIKNDWVPAIIYYFQIQKIIELLNQDEISGALVEIKNSYLRTSHFNQKHKLIPLDLIIEKIKENEQVLKDKYGVHEIYLFGSYAKGIINEYSDLDLIILIDDQKLKDINNKLHVIDFLKNKLGIEVDGKIVDCSFDKKELKIDILRHLKRVI